MQGFTDKEILGDGLSAQKATTALFNTASNECVHDNVRNTMLKILEQEESDLEVLFDVKSVESIQDFAKLSDVYSDGDAVIIELR